VDIGLPEEVLMKTSETAIVRCDICFNGDRRPARKPYVDQRNDRIAVVIDVPVDECSACGEVWLREEVALRLDELLTATLATDRVSVRSYADGADELTPAETQVVRELLREKSELETLNVQLQVALDTRILVEQAKAVVANREGINLEQAFAALREHARHHNLRLGDVAREIVEGSLSATELDFSRPR
jgi:YgiT-type zinc finger domain-containing protein